MLLVREAKVSRKTIPAYGRLTGTLAGRITTAAIAALAVMAAAGCGGGGGTPDAQPTTISDSFRSIDPQNSSGEYFHLYTVKATSDGTASVEMDSSTLDSYLRVAQATSSGDVGPVLAENDDMSSFTLNSRVSFPVSQGSTYYILAAEVVPSTTGSFTLIFSPDLTGLLRVDNSTRSYRSITSRALPKGH